ncbi:helix-turn-helix domain-containing protein [Pinisolibacter aquiterrae]|uniref:helix-turn-helix domain-containing protein n=1 Tax=Pinisolibacter aquiterrae TaxID=2815579 RepID=UPI001C3C3622|nr:helix-turn-helix domain-containing protein [Pinisolibacter aquiterrae]MBV5265677.1 winged helix-turn-helix domain-containing protein [Pinisolibacter aquiterrae]MCC8236758.1 helix-turn-helix domain-containing protein [Pinisolibacter aquiterrae]
MTDASNETRAVEATARHLGGVLRAMASARKERGLTSEEVLIFLAVGHLGLDGDGGLARVTPRTHGEIAAFLGIPRETVRRKIARLTDRGLTETTPHGVIVEDYAAWMALAKTIT